MFCVECCKRLFGWSKSAEERNLEMIKELNNDGDLVTECTTVMSMDGYMSAPTITVENDNTVKGIGLALAAVNIEQEAVYWEFHIEANGDAEGETTPVLVGVSTKRNPEFYKVLANSGGALPIHKHGTKLMKEIESVEDGDTLGVAFQKGDAPSIQLLKNGHTCLTFKVGRYRGDVYPAIWLPGKLTATLVSSENSFRDVAPHPRFQPIATARRLV